MQDIIAKIFPKNLPSIDELEIKYSKRDLPSTAMVTRICPSPTGFVHLGTIYMSLICKKFADQTNGVFFLRIEDTDKKREVGGAKEIIYSSLKEYGLDYDENQTYGPYVQSERKDIYTAYTKYLFEKDDAYLCFCTDEELKATAEEQERLKLKRGYYGKWAVWRNKSEEEVLAELDKNTPYVIRFKSHGDGEKTFTHHDLLKGNVDLPENDMDVPLLKKENGLPTYHLAHVVDDHLMRTTDVLRGDEWLSSVALHYDLFQSLNFPIVRYGHCSPINKLVGSSRRKLSKRKDTEANISFFKEKGFVVQAVIEYLLNLANSNFEDWRKENIDKNYTEFNLSMEKLAKSNGPLFDETKLRDIAKDKIARMGNIEVYDRVYEWAKEYDEYFYGLLNSNKEYWLKVFNIERVGELIRKDIAIWSELYDFYNFFDTEKFTKPDWSTFKSVFTQDEIENILNEYKSIYNPQDDKHTWLGKVKDLCPKFGLAPDIKAYKADKEAFKGHVGELTQLIRYAITGRTQSPDIYEILQVLENKEVLKRLTI
ncbi:glutamate--tRNA ligase [Arenimonas sp.]|nr:glutamate--tRNA ligase [Candidatus Parcubacteria bacterium]